MSSRALSNRWTTSWRGLSGSRRPFAAAGIAAALAWGLALVAAGPALADKRIALVIGNSAYQGGGLPALKNPTTDANDIANALKARGFDVIRGLDVGRAEMQRLVDFFTERARGADASVVYYAGHAFQLNDQNFLVPIDAKLSRVQDVPAQTVQIRTVLQKLEGDKGVHLVFLDACRNNPFKKAGDGDQSLRDGLARIAKAADFLFVFATQPGEVAYDGTGRNSFFAEALLNHIGTRGQDVGNMLIAVRKDVRAKTGGAQIPLDESSLTEQFYFVPGQAATVSRETQLWQLAASGSNDSALLGAYLNQYPNGPHADEARGMMKLASLPIPTTDARSVSVNGIAIDDRLWEMAQSSRVRSLVELYLSRNPNGAHATEARELLGSLPGQEDATPGQICDRLATHPRDATANNSGTGLAELAQNATVAIDACEKARAQNPELPHFTALLARAMVAAGRRDEGVRLYKEAAERGDLRAQVSLGLLLETGDGLPKDPKAAIALYEKAAAAGSPDAAINLAVAMMGGIGVERNPTRAVQLLNQAATAGSAIANFNLGVLAQDGVTSTKAEALKYFVKATELGEARGYVPAAILLDEGRGVPKDPEAASDMLLRGVASDGGEALNQLVGKSNTWSVATLKALQARLKKAGHFPSAIDGKGGAKLAEPLKRWRRFGSLEGLPVTR